MTRGFTDIHAHFVYGVDDGPSTLEGMQRMLDMAYADGITSLFATPHTTPGIYPFPIERFRSHLREAETYCEQMGYEMTLYEGAEILYTPAIERFAYEGNLPTLAGSDRILMEFVPDISLAELKQALSLMRQCGYRTVMAHVERYACLYGRAAYRLKQQFDVDFQMNCTTVLTGRGFLRDLWIKKWLKDGLIDFIATDSHDCERRPTQMQQAYEMLENKYGSSCACRMTGMKKEEKVRRE